MNRIFSDLLFIEGFNFMNQINVLGLIGTGNNRVFDTIEKETSQEYALKEILIREQHIYDQVLKEINLLGVLTQQQQDFVVRLKNFMICNQQVNNEYQPEPNRLAYILMEKGETSLARYIEIKKHQKQYFTVWEIRKIIKDLVAGFSYLQLKKIAHMDVKPENLLIMDVQNLTIKICDIGSGLKLEQDQISMAHTIVGTVPFMAPEMIECLQNKRLTSNVFKADVFSLGLCILYSITQKKLQTRERRTLKISIYKELIQDWTKLANLIIGQDIFIRKILQHMLLFDTSKRPDFIELNQIVQKELENEAKIQESEREEQIKILENKSNLSEVETPREIIFKKIDEVDELPKKIAKRKPSMSGRQKSAKRQVGTAIKNNFDQQNTQFYEKYDRVEKFQAHMNKQIKVKNDDYQSSNEFLNHQRSRSRLNQDVSTIQEKSEQKQEKVGTTSVAILKKIDLRIHLPPLNYPRLSPIQEPQHQLSNMLIKQSIQKKTSQLEPIEVKTTKIQNLWEDQSLTKQIPTEDKTPQRVIKMCDSDTQLQQGICYVMKLCDSKAFQKIQINQNNDLNLWLCDKIQEEFNLSMLEQYLISCSNIKKLYIKFEDLKFQYYQNIQSEHQNIHVQSFILEFKEFNEILSLFIQSLLERCNDLCFFHLVIDNIKDLNLLFRIAQSLSQIQKLQSVHLQINANMEFDEKEHKNLLQIISKASYINDLSLVFQHNNFIFSKSQWILGDKLKYLKLNYSGNQIEKSLNSLALSLGIIISNYDLGSKFIKYLNT